MGSDKHESERLQALHGHVPLSLALFGYVVFYFGFPFIILTFLWGVGLVVDDRAEGRPVSGVTIAAIVLAALFPIWFRLLGALA